MVFRPVACLFFARWTQSSGVSACRRIQLDLRVLSCEMLKRRGLGENYSFFFDYDDNKLEASRGCFALSSEVEVCLKQWASRKN